MKEQLTMDIISFFDRYANFEVELNTEINNDLKLIGDDADFVLVEFAKKFNVNLEGFVFSEYFVPELITYRFYRVFKPHFLKKPPLTVAHMIAIANKGCWFTPLALTLPIE